MSDMEEIKGLVGKINEALVPLRSEVETLKKRDGMDEQKFDKMTAQITEAMEKIQKAEAKAAAIEAAIQRHEPAAGDGKPSWLEDHRKKFDGFLRNTAKDRTEIEVRGMATTSQPDGGYLVRPELSTTVVTRVFETSPMRLVANVEAGSTKSREYLIDDDEADSGWVAEGATQSETATPQLGQKEIVAHTQRAQPNATWEMLADAYLDVEAWLAGKVSDRFSRFENAAFINGNGVGKPRGILTYPNQSTPGTYQRDTIRRLNTGASANITADGFITQQNAIKEAYQSRAVWGMNRTTFGEALKQKGADNYFFSPVLIRDGQNTLTLLGKPVIFMGDMLPVGAGNAAVVYGDFRAGYTIYDRVGLQVIRDPFSLAATGRVRFVTYKRVGGDVTNFEAFNIAVCATL